MNNFHPVFHHFFEEKYPQLSEFYHRRMVYGASVATSSVAGYITGLGDRHMQNILIKNDTAEVCHIDFGIMFEQGLLLSTPEVVPFRLTQNVVAGFPLGTVEGRFRITSEIVLSLMQDNKESLSVIFEIFL